VTVIRYRTQNSCYEYAPDDQLIRRTSGINNPTVRVGEDGKWKPVHSVSDQGEHGLIIVWGIDEWDTYQTTWTSPVVSREEVTV
jgi:hypothetical protein